MTANPLGILTRVLGTVTWKFTPPASAYRPLSERR
ncbi:hypothetical protein ACVIW0_004661 [Bradyrhizobium sp. USDA 4454]